MHEQIVYIVILVIIAIATLFDLTRRIIPNLLIIIGIVAWILMVIAGWLDGATNLAAGIAAGGLLLGVRWLGEAVFSQKGMGMGDVKLIFLIGLFLGWQAFWYLYLAIMAGGLWSLAALALKKARRDSRIAFAPFLLFGTCMGLTLLPFRMIYHLWY